MRDTIDMAREAGAIILDGSDTTVIDRLVALVRADERDRATEEANRRANASWTLMCEKMVAIEREACAKEAESWDCHLAAAEIRARGNT
jgi:hypothetical protein